MRSKAIIAILVCMIGHQHYMQAQSLPIDTLSSKMPGKPLVIYISGDGGFNSFSNNFIKQWNTNGYPVVALNAKSYFWKTKQPEAAAQDVTALITQYLSLWKCNEVILLGYSFGADVMPFIQMRLPAEVAGKVKHTVLFSPSANTDFTVHLIYGNNGSSVPAEINKITKPVLVVFGDEETNLPDKQINNKQVNIIKVPGDHHYDNNIATVVHEVAGKL